MRKTLTFVFAAVLMTAALPAQGPRGQQGRGSGTPQLDMSKVQTIAGTVSTVDIAYGTQYPSITIGSYAIKVAPVWFMLENDFEVKAGDALSVSAAPSLVPGDSYWYAIQITNTSTRAHISLRDSSGVPLWTGGNGAGPGSGAGPGHEPGSGPRNGAHQGVGCIDLTSIATATGTIDKVNIGSGIQMPTLTLKLDSGNLLTVKIGPERILLASDFELKAGDKLTVKYANATCVDEKIAISLTNAAGVTLVLREDDGTPNWH